MTHLIVTDSRQRRSLRIALLLFASLMAFQSLAKEVSVLPFYSHGMQLIEQGQAKIVARDPYIILPVSEQNIVTQPKDSGMQSLSLSLKIEQDATNNDPPETVYGDLFFKPLGQEHKFDPQYKIRFRYPSQPSEIIRFELPEDIQLASQLRLDFDNCSNCVIQHGDFFELGAASQLSTVIAADRIFNGTRKLPTSGIDTDPSQWRLNDMQDVDALLSFTGGDPFMVSPLFDVNTAHLAGVFLEFEAHNESNDAAPQKELSIYDFQLFYATENHEFIERSSSIFRVQSQPASSLLSVFVPLHFLARDNIKLLKQLRLDFATHSNYSSIDKPVTNWAFKTARLVHTSQQAELQKYLPQQMFTNTHHPFSVMRTISSILTKLFRDSWFLFVYLTLILLFCTLAWRKYRKTLNLQ